MQREIDKLIALRVVGALVKADVFDGPFDGPFERREDRPWEPLPYYSTQMDAIWPFYAGKDWILQGERGRWFVYEDYRAFEDGLPLGAAESAPLAICRALLESLKK